MIAALKGPRHTNRREPGTRIAEGGDFVTLWGGPFRPAL